MSEQPKQRGGKRPGSGRKKGMLQKLSGSEILKQIQRTTGKRFEELLAEHYKLAYTMQDWNAVRDYEKTILSKVVSDKVDITSNGMSIVPNYNFVEKELPEWNQLPVTITTIPK